mmetsp:Transcript_13597/g.34927  ORF Transcript_13597/g.34927 Transcript_13597/m.34927 type:complete len:86 (+) Transcript_13597:35-292(+)
MLYTTCYTMPILQASPTHSHDEHTVPVGWVTYTTSQSGKLLAGLSSAAAPPTMLMLASTLTPAAAQREHASLMESKRCRRAAGGI